MSKTVPTDLKTHMAGELSKMATCWRILRLDGTELFFTDHDTNITYDGDTYEADGGTTTTSVQHQRAAAVDNLEAMSVLSSERITIADLKAGLYDGALLDVFQVNHEDPTMGRIMLAQNWILGQVHVADNAVVVQVDGMASRLDQQICEQYSKTCRATLGDERCGVEMDYYAYGGIVTSVTDRKHFKDASLIFSDGSIFRHGTIVWEAGSANEGLSMEIKSYNSDTLVFELLMEMPNDIADADQFTAYEGCDRTLACCRDRFNNVANFRGEPYIPGRDSRIDVRKLPVNAHLEKLLAQLKGKNK